MPGRARRGERPDVSGQLIVPSRFAKGKPNRRKVRFVNPFAEIVKRRKSIQSKRYYGKVWKDTGYQPIPEAPGREMGKPHGTYISDMVELRKTILLCWRCKPKFFYKRALYYKDEVFPHASGRCDACDRYDNRGQLYLPEEALSDPGGMLRPGQCWTPR